jgi:hypothetical protein
MHWATGEGFVLPSAVCEAMGLCRVKRRVFIFHFPYLYKGREFLPHSQERKSLEELH